MKKLAMCLIDVDALDISRQALYRHVELDESLRAKFREFVIASDARQSRRNANNFWIAALRSQ